MADMADFVIPQEVAKQLEQWRKPLKILSKFGRFPYAVDPPRRKTLDEVAVLTVQAAVRFVKGIRPPKESLWIEDPITRDTMCDPVKCTDGRTYDRWTIIDNGITKSPFTRRPLAIAVDDIDVRSWLFCKIPEQEAKFHARRQNYRTKTREHLRGHPLRVEVAIEMLNNVLQWAPEDTECRNELDKILRDISRESCHLNSLPQEGDSQVYDFNEAPAISDENQTSPIPILTHRLRRERYSQGHALDRVAALQDRSPTAPIPVINHVDLIRERYGDLRVPALLCLSVYMGAWFFLFGN